MKPVDARNLAIKAHQGQKYGKYPYIYHLHDVYDLGVEFGLSDKQLCACYLHDILEDTSMKPWDMPFDVALLVLACTDGVSGPRRKKKEELYVKLNARREAIPVKICDRIANIEFSSVSNKKKHKMYMDEHEEFYSRLYREGECDELWEKYLSLI